MAMLPLLLLISQAQKQPWSRSISYIWVAAIRHAPWLSRRFITPVLVGVLRGDF